MASVLCSGADRSLIATRRLILEQAGHSVVTAVGEPEIILACSQHSFDAAVIGQTTSSIEKRRIFSLVRTYCPNTKILELYSPATGKLLPEADEWLEVPAKIPADLAERVSRLAA
jgi:hypothetical protein